MVKAKLGHSILTQKPLSKTSGQLCILQESVIVNVLVCI